jgi:hypothetical protein
MLWEFNTIRGHALAYEQWSELRYIATEKRYYGRS